MTVELLHERLARTVGGSREPTLADMAQCVGLPAESTVGEIMSALASEVVEGYLPRPTYPSGRPVRVGDRHEGKVVGGYQVFDTGWYIIEDEHGTWLEDAPYKHPFGG